VDIEFKEIDIDWPSEISVFELKNHVLANLINFGEPLRWAITSVTNKAEKDPQTISIEAVFIIKEEKNI
tara:strand:- start:4041 stop:4247 length:207 start_codon:yes stop_codon:yes gene_type:complete